MRPADTLSLSFESLRRFPMRTSMLLLAIAIGVAAVVMLTGVAEGARRYIVDEFAALGTNLVAVLPGKSETAGAGATGMLIGATARDLTLQDAMAIERSPYVTRVAPLVIGSGTASWGARERDITVLGANAAIKSIQHWDLEAGRFLPETELDVATPVCVLGSALVPELFGTTEPIGEWLRIGETRFRVIGVLRSAGLTGPFDTNETVIVPVASAQQLFNATGVFRLLAEATSRGTIQLARQDILRIVKLRHQGEEDVTAITQDAIVATFDTIFDMITLGLAAIAGISLIVAGVLIMNVMLVAVSQRTSEIGLLKAVGAKNRQIVALFLTEAGCLSLLGALLGLAVGAAGTLALRAAFPVLDFGPPGWAVGAALAIAVASGLGFGIMPARRAARLDPVQALMKR
ncbi:MAG TPA: ABC transporter permease [Gammaproteobacteria bacterium]|nr:ABC transporter permease [Gammaproteobacteria bacterium]